MVFSALIFDLDGTLIDSSQLVCAILNAMRIEKGLPTLQANEFIPYISYGGEELISYSLKVNEKYEIEELLKKFRMRYLRSKTSPGLLYYKVKDCLKILHKKYPLMICTNKPRSLAMKSLRDVGIDKYFSYVVAGGDLNYKKPNPIVLEHCLNILKLKSKEVLYIGDSLIDQNLCKTHAMPFAFHRKGYNDGVDQSSTYANLNTINQLRKLLKTQE